MRTREAVNAALTVSMGLAPTRGKSITKHGLRRLARWWVCVGTCRFAGWRTNGTVAGGRGVGGSSTRSLLANQRWLRLGADLDHERLIT